tara:strand:- start:362 stop:1666 length:1305 start_codon:yes stop_codon:yes gene_type:complete
MSQNRQIKILLYVFFLIPLLIFGAELTSLFFLKGNNINKPRTKYDAITGWRKECKNNYSNLQNEDFLICNKHGLIKTPYQTNKNNAYGILLLGNSVAMGEGLYGHENKKTFASQLEFNLRSKDQSIDLINAAYAGFNTWQEHSEMVRYLNVEPFYDDLPALNMVVSFGGIQDFWGFFRLLKNIQNSSKLEYAFANNMMIEKTNIDYINFLSSSSSGNIKSGLFAFINSIKSKSNLLEVLDRIYKKTFSSTKRKIINNVYNRNLELVINQNTTLPSNNLKEIIKNSFGLTFEEYINIRNYFVKSTIRNISASSNLLHPEIKYVYVYAPTFFSSLSEEELDNDKYVVGIKHLVGYPKFAIKIFESEMKIIERDYRNALLSEMDKISYINVLDYSGKAKSFWFFDYSHFTEYGANQITINLSKELLLIKNSQAAQNK